MIELRIASSEDAGAFRAIEQFPDASPYVSRAGLLDPKYDWIDWERIAADAEEDDRLGVQPDFDSSHYPDHESAMKALDAYIHSIYVEAMYGSAPCSAVNAARHA